MLLCSIWVVEGHVDVSLADVKPSLVVIGGELTIVEASVGFDVEASSNVDDLNVSRLVEPSVVNRVVSIISVDANSRVVKFDGVTDACPLVVIADCSIDVVGPIRVE